MNLKCSIHGSSAAAVFVNWGIGVAIVLTALGKDALVVTLSVVVLVVTNDGVAVGIGVDVTGDSTAVVVTIVVAGGSEGVVVGTTDSLTEFEEHPAMKTKTMIVNPKTKFKCFINSFLKSSGYIVFYIRRCH